MKPQITKQIRVGTPMHTALISLCENCKPFNVGGIDYKLVDAMQVSSSYIRVILEKV